MIRSVRQRTDRGAARAQAVCAECSNRPPQAAGRPHPARLFPASFLNASPVGKGSGKAPERTDRNLGR